MLRVEKNAQSKPVYLSVRENARMLTPTFIRALIFALALHLSALILFHVQPFRLKYNSPQYPPIQVNIELALPENAIFADLEQRKLHRFPIPEPPLAPSVIPHYGIKMEDRVQAVPKNMKIRNTILPIETEGDLSHLFVTLDPGKHAVCRTPVIQISGPLASLPIVADSLPAQSIHAKKHSLVRLQYSVKVDSRTGKIFWYAPNTQTDGKKIQKTAEDILERIQFNPAPSEFVTQGEIELYLAVMEKGK
jgi:hypothetical protein